MRSNSFVVSRDDSINVVIYRVLKIKVLCVLGGGGAFEAVGSPAVLSLVKASVWRVD